MRHALKIGVLLAMGCGTASTDVSCYEILDECSCYARSHECKVVADSCWCPSMCGSTVECFCGGGKFLRCEPQTVP